MAPGHTLGRRQANDAFCQWLIGNLGPLIHANIAHSHAHVFQPDTTAHLKTFCVVHGSISQCCFSVEKGDLHNIRQVVNNTAHQCIIVENCSSQYRKLIDKKLLLRVRDKIFLIPLSFKHKWTFCKTFNADLKTRLQIVFWCNCRLTNMFQMTDLDWQQQKGPVGLLFSFCNVPYLLWRKKALPGKQYVFYKYII